ncbi:16S rRNA (cytosine(1402)-N(4))-methyltransferase RsmH, partial [Candidatus Saccharibacteria bacterium]|nr:16S rRNA (cytosine(1402)-N(4))-methyltransferase RsmH [Candidatus Saccharibacteria bacterium]
MKETHIPVLKSEVLEVLQPQTGESYLDLTAGYAGHASEILAATQNYKDSVLVDRDPNACKVLHEKFDKFPVEILQKDFYSSTLHLLKCGKTFDMILVDLGVSSPQLDNPERGFSFMNDGPLDMRMDTTQDLTAEQIVNTYKREDLERILTEYGDESIVLASKHER